MYQFFFEKLSVIIDIANLCYFYDKKEREVSGCE